MITPNTQPQPPFTSSNESLINPIIFNFNYIFNIIATNIQSIMNAPSIHPHPSFEPFTNPIIYIFKFLILQIYNIFLYISTIQKIIMNI